MSDKTLPLDTGKTVYRVRRWDRSSDYEGQKLEVGQLVNLVGATNDPLLVRFGYFEPWTGGPDDVRQCGECGKSFDSDRARNEHGDKAHRPQEPLDPDLEEQQIDKEFARLERQAPFLNVGVQEPVNLDNTPLPNNTIPVVSAAEAPNAEGPAIDATQVTRDILLMNERENPVIPKLSLEELPPSDDEPAPASAPPVDQDGESGPGTPEPVSPIFAEPATVNNETADMSNTGDTSLNEKLKDVGSNTDGAPGGEDAAEETPQPRRRRRAASDGADASDV